MYGNLNKNSNTSNVGQLWSLKEEELLLFELKNNMSIHAIADNHKRTVGGINARRKQIAHKMFIRKMPIEEIIKQTKLDYYVVQEIIEKHKNSNKPKIDTNELQNDIANIKKDINEMKQSIIELANMVKSMSQVNNTYHLYHP